MGLSLADQTAYGLSTYLVTAAAARTSGPALLGRFMTVWVTSWLALTLMSAGVLIPLRLALAHGKVQETQVHGLQRLVFVAGAWTTALAALAAAVGGLVLTHIVGGLAVTTVGFAYTLTRGLGYNSGHEGQVAIRSTGNLLLTLPLLGTVLALHGSITHWGLTIAAAALLPSAVPAPAPRISWREGFQLITFSKRESLWNTVSASVSGGVFGAGLMWLVATARGAVETGHLAQVLVIVTPVQLASATLPLLSLHRLAAAASDREAFVREWIQELKVYALLAVAGFGTLFAIYGPWTRLILGEVGKVPWSAATGCGLGILLGSWASTAVRAGQSARSLLVGPATAGIGVIAGTVLGVPTMYLLTLVYGIAAGGHTVVAVTWLWRGAPRSGEDVAGAALRVETKESS